MQRNSPKLKWPNKIPPKFETAGQRCHWNPLCQPRPSQRTLSLKSTVSTETITTTLHTGRCFGECRTFPRHRGQWGHMRGRDRASGRSSATDDRVRTHHWTSDLTCRMTRRHSISASTSRFNSRSIYSKEPFDILLSSAHSLSATNLQVLSSWSIWNHQWLITTNFYLGPSKYLNLQKMSANQTAKILILVQKNIYSMCQCPLSQRETEAWKYAAASENLSRIFKTIKEALDSYLWWVPASAGVKAGKSPLPGSKKHCVIPYGMWFPVAVR